MTREQEDTAGRLHDLAPLYAVDALEPAERAGFEEHLAQCPRCRAEVDAYSDAAAGLAAGTAQAPPPALRSAVLSAVHGTRPHPSATPEAEAHSGAGPFPDAGARTDAEPLPRTVSLDERRRRRGRLLLAAAAAAVLLPGIAVGGWTLGVQSEQRQQEQAAAREQDREDRLLSAPDLAAQRVEVSGEPATLIVSRDQDAALFVAGALPDPGPGREYQLWLLEGETAIPDARFSGGSDVSIWLTGDISRAGNVALTVEPAGGSETPTLPILAVAEI